MSNSLRNPKRRHHLQRFTAVQLTGGLLFALLLAGPAVAQYGGPGAPTYGAGKAVAVGAVAAGAGAGILYLTLHHRGSLTGCVEGSDATLRLVDDKKHQIFSLLPGNANLQSGMRVEVRGKKTKDEEGTQAFRVSKVVKDLGNCVTQ
jgi:hypothetical protein